VCADLWKEGGDNEKRNPLPRNEKKKMVKGTASRGYKNPAVRLRYKKGKKKKPRKVIGKRTRGK